MTASATDHSFRTLSKSDFKAARTCSAKLYYREQRYPSTDEADPYLRMLAEGGYMVEMLARLRYPAGATLEYGGDPRLGASATSEALKAENVTLFEATLLAGHRLARADILVKSGNEFRLIEVKAKSFNSAENAARLEKGEPNIFRGKRKPFGINSEWREYLEDVAFQVGVLRALVPGAVIRPYLCLVDKSATTAVDGLPSWFSIERRASRDGTTRVHRAVFIGDVDRARAETLTVEIDVSSEVADLAGQVESDALAFEASIANGLKRIPGTLGFACRECEYRVEDDVPNGFKECWGELADAQPSVLDLYQGGRLKGATAPLVEELLSKGKASLFDIPDEACKKADGSIGPVAARQLIQLEHSRSGKTWLGDGLAPAIRAVEYPLHFVDFETSRIALPYHAGMRPYGLVAFQWSCHTVSQPGEKPKHTEWINIDDTWPNGRFATSLREALGDRGTVLAWATHESSTMKEILRELPAFGQSTPDLDGWIQDLAQSNRILDLNRLAREAFFHPSMGGRTSIKVVLDGLWKLDEEMRGRFEEITKLRADKDADPYAALPPLEINGVRQQVVEGTGAMRAYQAMMYGVERDDATARKQWRDLLLQYCGLDSLAMVLIWEYWGRCIARSQ